ncbi:DUF948 domain-containing protein [Rossellomorea oryzaecorticis]|uniref:DUF948 domain-containing protein n=1 Tax=Rossellomorea oryzaecorticis TaxID=1396505 RepID=A0ABU9K938_9BACI
MWIVYTSIALVAAALIMLTISVVKTLKTTRPAINSINQTVNNIQTNMDHVTAETDQLQTTQGEIQQDIENKKSSIMYTVDEAKQIPKVAKEFVKSMKR